MRTLSRTHTDRNSQSQHSSKKKKRMKNADFKGNRRGYGVLRVSFRWAVLLLQTSGGPSSKSRADAPAEALWEFSACSEGGGQVSVQTFDKPSSQQGSGRSSETTSGCWVTFLVPSHRHIFRHLSLSFSVYGAEDQNGM